MTALPTIPVEHRLRLVETGGAPMSAPSDDGPTGQATPLLADEAAERRVLASVLFNPDNCLVPVRELVPSPEAFAVPRHAALYRVLLGMADARVPIEWATLESQLRTTTRQGDFEAFSALAIELVDEPNWDAGPARHFAALVASLAARRATLATLADAMRRVADTAQDYEPVVASAVDSIVRHATPGAARRRRRSTQELCQDVLTRLEIDERSAGLIRGIPADLPCLDALTDGWQKSRQTVLAARPSVGKSALSLDQAIKAAVESDVLTVYCSAEMSAPQLMDRAVGNLAGVSLRWVRKQPGRLARMTDRLATAATALAQAPLVIEDRARTPAQIKLAVQRAMAEYGRPVGLVIVDYVQLLQSDRPAQNRNYEIGQIGVDLFHLAHDEDCHVMLLSQLSREIEKSRKENGTMREPNMADLRDSGELEQCADLILFLHRNEKDPNWDGQPHDSLRRRTRALLVKNRDGEVGDCDLWFDKPTGRWDGPLPEPGHTYGPANGHRSHDDD
jgi:replicative DNA helicase